MFLKNYHHLKNKEIYILIFLFLSSALVRIPAILVLGDAGLDNEWKEIVSNLIEYGRTVWLSYTYILS